MAKLKIANKEGYKWGEIAYLIGHEFGTICVSYGDCEQSALDNAVDDGFMDTELMADNDRGEYERNEWYDSFIIAGNAGEALWSEYLWIKPASERRH